MTSKRPRSWPRRARWHPSPSPRLPRENLERLVGLYPCRLTYVRVYVCWLWLVGWLPVDRRGSDLLAGVRSFVLSCTRIKRSSPHFSPDEFECTLPGVCSLFIPPPPPDTHLVLFSLSFCLISFESCVAQEDAKAPQAPCC